jgi:hypothetical protein
MVELFEFFSQVEKAPLVLPLCLRIEHFTRVAESTDADATRE